MGVGANCDTVTLNYSTTTQTLTNTLYTALPHQTILDSINWWLQNIKIANFRKIQILY